MLMFISLMYQQEEWIKADREGMYFCKSSCSLYIWFDYDSKLYTSGAVSYHTASYQGKLCIN